MKRMSRRRQAREELGDAGQKRMVEYLRATQTAFEAALVRANALAQSDSGVLAGPRVRLKRPSEK